MRYVYNQGTKKLLHRYTYINIKMIIYNNDYTINIWILTALFDDTTYILSKLYVLEEIVQ